MLRAMSRIEQRVLAALGAHPHDDTPERIAALISGPRPEAGAIDAALERLRREGLVHTANGHWQLTRAGFRIQRAA